MLENYRVARQLVAPRVVLSSVELVSQARNQHKTDSMQGSGCYLLHAGFVLGVLFSAEDGSGTFLENTG
jgi:hypothetical protein